MSDSSARGEPADGRAEPTADYEAAAARVEEIIRRLDSGEASLNETLELVSEGKALIELCASELAAVGDALEELRLDELVSRLEERGRAREHLGAARRAAAGDRGLRARAAAGDGLERVRAQDARSSACAAPARRASARTSPTTRSTTRSCRPPGPMLPLAGRFTLASFSEHLAGLDAVPAAAAARGLRSATAPGRMSRRRSTSRCARRTRRCTRRSGASREPVRFVVSLRLGEPPSIEPVRRRLELYPGAALQARPDELLGRAR